MSTTEIDKTNRPSITDIEGEIADTPLTISGGSTTDTTNTKDNAEDRNVNDDEEPQQGTWEVEDEEAAREVLGGGGIAADTDEDGSRSMLNMSRDTHPDMSNYNNNLQSGEEGDEEEKEEKETTNPPPGVDNTADVAVPDIVRSVVSGDVVGGDAVVVADVVTDNVTTIPTTMAIAAAGTGPISKKGAATLVSKSSSPTPPPSRPSNILQSHKVVLNHQPAIKKKKGYITNSRRDEEATIHSLTSSSMSSNANNADISQGKENTRRPPFTPRLPPSPHRPYIVHEHHQLDSDGGGQPIDVVKRYDRALRGNKLPSLPSCSNSPRHHSRVVSSASRSIRGPAEVKFPLNPPATNCKSVQLAHVKRSGRAVNAELVVQSREPVVSVFTIRKPELTTAQIDQLNWGDEGEEGESGGRTNATMDVVSVRSSRRTSPHHRCRQNGAAAAEQLVFLGQESTVTGTVLRVHDLPVTTSDVSDLVKRVDMLSPRSQFPTEEKRMYVAVPDRRHVEGRGCRQYPDHRTRYHSGTLFGGGVTMDDGSSVARISATPCTIMAVEHYDKEFMRKQLCGVTSSNKVYRPLSSATHTLSSTLSHSEGTLSVLGTSHVRMQDDDGSITNGMPPTSGRMRVDEDRRLLTSSHYASTQSRKYSLDNVINQAQLIRGELAGTARHTQLPECPSFLSMSAKRPIKVRHNQPTATTLDIMDDVTATLNLSKVTPASTSSSHEQQRQPKGPAEMYYDRQVQENMQLDRIYHQQATSATRDDDGESGPNASEDEARRAETARRRYDNHQMSLLAVTLPSCL